MSISINSIMKKLTMKEVLDKINKHNNDYPNKHVILCENQIYESMASKMSFLCLKGHKWSSRLREITSAHHGCPHCEGNIRYSHEEYVDKIEKVEVIDKYINSHTKINHKCLVCDNIWATKPIYLLTGHGCPACARETAATKQRNTKDELISLLNNRNLKHPDKIVNFKHIENYKNLRTKMIFVCCKNHEFYARPHDVFRGDGCPQCRRRPYSKKAIAWLKTFNGLNIQHAENGGEFLIQDTKWKADGYDPITKTIYEFYGNAFHGNPTIYNKDDKCHPYDKTLSAGFLYNRTVEREKLIKEMGYNIITIWEDVWDAQIKHYNML